MNPMYSMPARKSMAYFVAASLSVAGLGLIGCDRDNETTRTKTQTQTQTGSGTGQRTGERVGESVNRGMDRAGDVAERAAEKTGAAVDTAGEKVGNAARAVGEAMTPSDARGAYDVLGQVTNAALTKGGFDDLVERLAKDDRDRIGPYANSANFDDLDQKVAAIQSAWQSKYNGKFDLGKTQEVFGNDVKLSNMQAPANGMQTAMLTMPAMQNADEVKLNLVREGGSWKIDLNNNVTGPQLKHSLMKHLDEVQKMQDKWPSEGNQGYRLVAQHVLMALSEAGR